MKMTAKDVKEITSMPCVTFFSVLQPPLVRRELNQSLCKTDKPQVGNPLEHLQNRQYFRAAQVLVNI